MILCKPFKIIVEREKLLLEAIVVNPQQITRYLETLARDVKAPEGKQWFLKKLRISLINTPNLLKQINQQNSAYPDYANNALSQGQPVYEFDDNNPNLSSYEQRVFRHIIDWFNAMSGVLERTPTNEVERNDLVVTEHEFSKIMKYDTETAFEHANEWFRLMGTRLKGTKEGVEIVYTWSDGFYAVRYLDKNTMMTDGRDLQNCLQNGTYWDSVENGTNAVYGIRNPKDEAVVGIRVEIKPTYKSFGQTIKHPPELEECKGKNNQPVTAAYRPYVVEFLNVLGVKASKNHDLASADIHYNNGKYGTFTETADLVYDKGGLKLWKGDDRILAQFGKNNELDIQTHAGSIVSFAATNRWPAKMTLSVLNTLKIPPARNLADQLQRGGVAYDSATNQYLPLDEAGRVLGEFDGYKAVSLGLRFLLLKSGKVAYQVDVVGKAIESVSQLDNDLDEEQIIKFLNLIQMRPNVKTTIFLIRKMNIAFNGTIYGPLEDVMKEVDFAGYADGDAQMYRAGDLREWVAVAGDRDENNVVVLIGVNQLNITGLGNKTDSGIIHLIRRLIQKEGFTSVPSEQTRTLGVLNVPKIKSTKTSKVVTSAKDVFENLQAIAESQTTIQNDMPFVNIDKDLFHFLENIKHFDDDYLVGELTDEESPIPKDYDKLLAQYVLPKGKEKVTFKPMRTRQLFSTQVIDYEIIFSLAAMEISFLIQNKIPEVLNKALEIGVTQALAKVKENSNDMFSFDKSPLRPGTSESALRTMKPWMTPEAERAIEDLAIVIREHNEQLKAHFENKLRSVSSESDLSDRFAALNLKRSIQDKKR